MKYLWSIAFLTYLFFPFFSKGENPEPYSIQVIDTKNNPVVGVYIVQHPQQRLIGSTDGNGNIEIEMSDFLPEEKLIFQCMGFHSDTLIIKEIKTRTTIVLEENSIQLPESVVSVTPVKQLLAQTHKQLQQKYKAKESTCRYYGNGIYSKAVECNGKTVQLFHEYGLFLTSGNCPQKDKFDLEYRLNFIPVYTARSYDLNCSGSDTLKYISISGNKKREEIRFDATSRKIFNIMRTIYLYAPLFVTPEYFEFKLTDIDSSYYTIHFSTKPECFPQKVKGFSRGILQIDRKNQQLRNITLEYFDYYLYTLSSNPPEKVPYITKVKAQFAYDQEQHAYIDQATCETQWKYKADYQADVYSIETPSRPFASKNQLVEKESWKIENYQPIPKQYQNTEIAVQSDYASNSAGTYTSLFIEKYPNPFATPEAQASLSRYCEIEQQYQKNSDKLYCTEFQITHWDSEFLRKMKLAKKNLLNYFYQDPLTP